jgi:CheY-like chemotaxis protein
MVKTTSISGENHIKMWGKYTFKMGKIPLKWYGYSHHNDPHLNRQIKVFGFGLCMNVLIIHRQLSFLKKIREKFSLGGWQVQTTDSGLDGLLTARHHHFDLMICGFDLPLVSGMEVVRSTRLVSVNTTIPVFFLKDGFESEKLLGLALRLEAKTMDEREIETWGKMACL